MTTQIKPQAVTGLDIVFGGDVKKLLPPMEQIPKGFHDHQNKWHRLVEQWFFKGLKKLDVTPREGIERRAALGHVKACMASCDPKHEHKVAGCAYLMSQFFEDEFKYEVAK
ncbi:hypothetical protein ACFFSY_29240 [Paenibacillus aurantiacus]|uniref:Uncharacterized protein n=1 Tax=Paenibacillus aurantiacus TaxID=1936118 RepID=A0ABV5KXV4_9BACL